MGWPLSSTMMLSVTAWHFLLFEIVNRSVGQNNRSPMRLQLNRN